MNCPKCKNPVEVNSKECEWCGNKIIEKDDFIELADTISTQS